TNFSRSLWISERVCIFYYALYRSPPPLFVLHKMLLLFKRQKKRGRSSGIRHWRFPHPRRSPTRLEPNTRESTSRFIAPAHNAFYSGSCRRPGRGSRTPMSFIHLTQVTSCCSKTKACS